MDQLMWVVTFVALSLAVGMSVVAVRLLGGDRRRRAARVAALEAAAFEPTALDLDDEPQDEAPITYAREAPAARPTHSPRVTMAVDEEVEFELAGLRAQAPAFDEYRAQSNAAMFAATEEPKAPSRRWFAFAAVAVVMAALAGTAYTLFKPATLGASSSNGAGQNQNPSPNQNPATPEPRNPGTPLDLLSLKHTIDDGTFTVAGLVQNPLAGAPYSRVIAVVYLFDKDGAYFATGRADLEFTGLRPGEESPFTIKVAGKVPVGRYRVGFRRDDGAVIAHVDKRGQATAGLMTEGRD